MATTYKNRSGYAIWIRKLAQIILAAALFLLLLYFIFRNTLLNYLLKEITVRMKVGAGLELIVDKARFSGFTEVELAGIHLLDNQEELFMRIDTLRIRPDILRIPFGALRVEYLYCANSQVWLKCMDGKCNFRNTGVKSDTLAMHSPAKVERDYSRLLNEMIRRIFNYAPQQADIRNFQATYSADTLSQRVIIPAYYSDQDSIGGTLFDPDRGQSWGLSGSYDQSGRQLDLSIFPKSRQDPSFPFLEMIMGAKVGADTLHFALKSLNHKDHTLFISGHFSGESIFVEHTRLATEPIRIEHLLLDFQLRVGRNSIQVDSSSYVELNKLRIHTYLYAEKRDTNIQVDLKIRTAPAVAINFFQSLPEGMFTVARKLNGDGQLTYQLEASYNSLHPDSLVFNSNLFQKKFKYIPVSNDPLLKMNGSFLHQVFEQERLQRSFVVGPENPAYTPLEAITPNFIKAVLTSEDGNFFVHRGFNEEAFRQSVITNIRAKRFVRGGSTISMQLIKNVFLSRNKTIARKAEEALLVWLIENKRLCSKERMLEVYMNIIELGPGIYGIGEAAPFYFGKTPAQLNLSESIFLAGLLPRPKAFRYQFDKDAKLKPYLADYYRVVSNFMLRKNLITQEEYDQLSPQVVLNGPALKFVLKPESVPESDSVEFEMGFDQFIKLPD